MNPILVTIIIVSIVLVITLILTIVSLTQISVIYKKASRTTTDTDEIHGILATTDQPNISRLGNLFGVKIAGKGPFAIDYGTDSSQTSTGDIKFEVSFSSPPVVVCQIINNTTDAQIQDIKVYNVTKDGFSYTKTYLNNLQDGIQMDALDNFHWLAIGEY